METCKIEPQLNTFSKNVKAGCFLMVFETNGKHRLYLDEYACSLLGVDLESSPEDAFSHVARTVADADKNMVMSAVKIVLTGETSTFDFTYGDDLLSLRCVACKSCSKRGPSIEGIVLNVTKITYVRKDSPTYQDQLYEHFYSLPFVGYIKNLETGQFLSVTQQFDTLFNNTGFKSLLGKTDFDIFDSKTAKQIIQEDQYCLTLNRPLVMNEKYLDTKGTMHFFKGTRFKYMDSYGRVDVVAILFDVTEIQSLLNEKEALIAKTKEQMDALGKSKSKILETLSTEVKIPSQSILGYVDKATRNKDNKEIVLDALNEILKNAIELTNISSGINEIVSLKTSATKLNETPNDIVDVIKICGIRYKKECEERGISLRYDLRGIKNRFAIFDKDKLTRIICQVISTSIKFSREKGAIILRGKQVASAKEGCAKYIISIEDDGIGMSQHFLKNVITIFNGESGRPITEFEGSGIGVAVIKALTDAMKGEIKVYSGEEEVTRCDVIVNFRVIDQNRIKEFNEREDMTFIKSLSKGKKVLLIDDNDTSRSMNLELLKEYGFEVETAINGAFAANIVSKSGADYFSLIFTKLRMPVMDGYEAANEIRSLYPESKTPIIGLKTHESYQEYDVENKDMNLMIETPLTEDKLKDIIYAYLKKK